MSDRNQRKKQSGQRRRAAFPIAGIGASAGGLDAFKQLLQRLPPDTDMAFVLVQHLDPDHESALTRLLSKATSMPVTEVTDNTRVAPNHVYVIPPNRKMTIADGVLKLSARKRTRGQYRSIDYFLESLAEDQRERAIGVILSGTANDGTLGLEAIKGEGGITFAQDESAAYDSMPRSAIAAGCVDFVLSPEKIADELARIARHPYVAGELLPAEAEREFDQGGGKEAPLASGGRGRPRTGAKQARTEADVAPKGSPLASEDGFKKILLLVRRHAGVDFSLYKSSTIQRRITRRMVLNKHTTIAEYADFLRGNGKELDELYSDMLIAVTSFFRNPEAFEILKDKVFPELIGERSANPVRVWVLGCSTGQEAYSIAMTYIEAADRVPHERKLQVFATDLNDALLDKARNGLYTKTLVNDVSPDRLRRFFVEEEGGFRVSKELRQIVVFARQNVLSDPPFSHMDLVSCRNLLIYLDPELQKRLVPMFHYTLNPNGFLFLGASESIGGFSALFATVDKKYKLFAKKPAHLPGVHLPMQREQRAQKKTKLPQRREHMPEVFRTEINAQREADRLSISQFAPPGVLIDSESQILQFRGDTSAYLRPPSGKASFDLLKMAREGLMLPLRATINKAKKENRPASRENVHLKHKGQTRPVNLEVIPLRNVREGVFLVWFKEAPKSRASTLPKQPRATGKRISKTEQASRVAELQRELDDTRDYLQSIHEQYEAANEELQAQSEEVESANEELQSVNEELETSKEELESANEELMTVNEEMVNRNAELLRLNSDLNNLSVSIKTAVLLLGPDLTVRSFTPAAEKVFNLLASDVGRPLSAIRHNLSFPELEKLLSEVIDTVSMRELEVQDRDDRWYLLRVRPYMTVDKKIDGAVLVLTDIDEVKRAEEARAQLAAIVDSSTDAVISKTMDGTITSWNWAAQDLFGYTAEEMIGRQMAKLFPADCLKEEEEILAGIGAGKPTLNRETVRIKKNGNAVPVSVTISPMKDNAGRIIGASDILHDISARKQAESEKERLMDRERKARAEADAANRFKDEFLAIVSHELRTPLNAIGGWAEMLKSGKLDQASAERAIDTIARNARAQATIIDELLDTSRIITGKLKLDNQQLDLTNVINAALDVVRPTAEAKAIEISASFDPNSVPVVGDAIRLQQVVWNLLANAVRFTSKRGRIEVRLERVGTDMVIVVTDNGEGIAPDVLPRIFERFQQADTTASRQHGGLGLGLSIGRQLVQMHGGSIRAKSKGLGQGATFTVTLPIMAITEKPRGRAASAESPRGSVALPDENEKRTPSEQTEHGAAHAIDLPSDLLNGVRVLAVDDQPDTLELIIVALKKYGAEVKACSDAHIALEAVKQWKPDIIVSDIGMPNEDGYQLIQKIRALPAKRGGKIPAIALTGYAGVGEETKALAAGYQTHLVKPVELTKLAAEVARYAGNDRSSK
ncbi:MAG TPA: chemotaxis protein CheB [Pyrinomonadaceae bacterium]|nr:chemotaxis protein CheB [Pyrinomonadaceae bacterium]